MSFNIRIPTSDSPLECTLQVGEIIFMLGANGTGKSSLMQQLYRDHRGNARWISAHRQNWFGSESINLSSQQNRDYQRYISDFSSQSRSRWMDDYASSRADIAIYGLIELENRDGRAFARAARANRSEEVEQLKQQDPPLLTISNLLKASNIPIDLSLSEEEQVVAAKQGGPAYSIAYLSDGERNAVLIAAEILAATPGSLILVDEPERHLHRSIISPLLAQLFKKREDCAFLVSTHDILLPLDRPRARTVLLRRCLYAGGEIESWDADILPPDTEVGDALKRDILGSRRKILFIEGTSSSLDQPLYSLLFPGTSVIPKENCREVEYAVRGIRGADGLHWIRGFGIVDNDARSTEEIERLMTQGIYAVPAYSVESIYYHPEIQRRVVERHSAITGSDPNTLLANSEVAALAAISGHAERMAQRVAEKEIRAEVFRQIPGRAEVQAGQPININIDTAALVGTELARFTASFESNDLTGIIVRYPVRETPALSQISANLGFQNRDQYESAVLKLLVDVPDALAFVRGLFGNLWQAIEAS